MRAVIDECTWSLKNVENRYFSNNLYGTLFRLYNPLERFISLEQMYLW